MKSKLAVMIILTMAISSLMGCSSNGKSKQDEEGILIANASNIDKEQVKDDTIRFLTGTDTSKLKSYSDDLKLDWNDTCNSAKNAKTYLSNSAYYLQYGDNMYRFQFNNDGKVESYIKYKVEA